MFLQIESGDGSDSNYLDPESLSEEELHNLKQAMESVVGLQKLAHHAFSEHF
jgi:hypothetical protein